MRLAGLLVVLVLLVGCGFGIAPRPTVQISSDRNPQADIAAYHTYAWLTPPPNPSTFGPNNDAASLDWRIRAIVNRQLAARRYQETSAATADFLIEYDLKATRASADSFQQYFAYREAGGEKSMGEAFVGYREGSLVLAVIDRRSRQIVWRASATAVVEKPPTDDLVAQAVSEMLDRLR